MNTKLMVEIGVSVFVLGLTLFFFDMSYDNQHARNVADIEAQEQKIESSYDKMFKTIAQQAEVTNHYFDKFKDIYKGIMGGRYGDGGSKAMWQWLKEANPEITPEMHMKLMNTIEVSREGFHREQTRLASMSAEDKKLFVTKPAKWFTSGEHRKVKIISSTRAKWEKLENYSNSSRLKVPGGWIVRTFENRGVNTGGYAHQIFIKDENHIWKIK